MVTELAEGYTGTFKIQATGPFTLATALELPVGGVMLRDPGAVRELVESLADGLRSYAADVAARLPGATVVLQLDEPSLPVALAGRVPTESGFGALRPVEEPVARDALAAIVDAAGVPVVVHCCAPDVPIGLFAAAGAAGVALDLGQVADLDALGEAIDAGLGLFAGAVRHRRPAAGRPPSSDRSLPGYARSGRSWVSPADRLAAQVVVAPACGLAGLPAAYARGVLAACRDAGRRLVEE